MTGDEATVTELPLFPLHVVLFPGRALPLHLFEPRYREMLEDCLETDRRFGVIAIRDGHETSPRTVTYEVGTVAEIIRVERLEDGRSHIVTVGVERFAIRDRFYDTAYLRARVELLPERASERMNGQHQRLRRLLVPYLQQLGASDELADRLPESPVTLAWLAAAALQVDLAEQQRLLECATVDERIEEAVRILRRETGFLRHFGTVGTMRPAGPGRAELN